MRYCTNLVNDRTFFMSYRPSDMHAANSEIRLYTSEVGDRTSDMLLYTAAIGYQNSVRIFRKVLPKL